MTKKLNTTKKELFFLPQQPQPPHPCAKKPVLAIHIFYLTFYAIVISLLRKQIKTNYYQKGYIMTTKQMLLSATLMLGATNALAMEETSTNSPHIVLNNIPMFKKIGDGIFIIEDIGQRAYTKKYKPALFNEIPKLGVICNNKRFAIFNSNQESDCDLVLNHYSNLLQEKKRDLNYNRQKIHNLEKKLATETNEVRQDFICALILWNITCNEVNDLEKMLNAMNGIQ